MQVPHFVSESKLDRLNLPDVELFFGKRVTVVRGSLPFGVTHSKSGHGDLKRCTCPGQRIRRNSARNLSRTLEDDLWREDATPQKRGVDGESVFIFFTALNTTRNSRNRLYFCLQYPENAADFTMAAGESLFTGTSVPRYGIPSFLVVRKGR